MYEAVLKFWFEEIDSGKWWVADPAFDAQIRARFLDVLESAARGELYAWRADARGRLAEVIVLDQFSRNIHRNTARAFAQDPVALVLAQEGVAAGVHRTLSPTEASFLMMPYMHSESAAIHAQAASLYGEFASPNSYQFELKHKAIIDRFGRYPHRNAILGRTSTPEEIEFLQQPGSSF